MNSTKNKPCKLLPYKHEFRVSFILGYNLKRIERRFKNFLTEELCIPFFLYMTSEFSDCERETLSVLCSEVCLFSICWNLISRGHYLSLTHTPAREYVSGVSIQLSNAERIRQRKQSERNEEREMA